MNIALKQKKMPLTGQEAGIFLTMMEDLVFV
jgi:hypothetical protein